MSTRIREFRKLRGMTLQALANQVGTTAQTIQRLETGNMTVSLDWLVRIAEVFGMPAAALLVSDTTASVPVLGNMDGKGYVTRPAQEEQASALSLVIAAPQPVAVHVSETISGAFAQHNYLQGSWLIGSKTDVEDGLSIEVRDCLVATADGRVRLQRASVDDGNVQFEPDGSGEARPRQIAWIAPVLMAVRYF